MYEDSKSRARRSRKNKKDHKFHKNPEVKHGNLIKEVVKNDLSVNVYTEHSNSIIEKIPRNPLLINKKLKDLDLIVEDKIFMSDDHHNVTLTDHHNVMPDLIPASYSDTDEINPGLSVIEISSDSDDKKSLPEIKELSTESNDSLSKSEENNVVVDNGGVFSYITSFFW